MKRYLFGALAIVIGTCAVAFTSPKKSKHINYFTFYYDAPGGTSFTQANVETESNWKTAPGTIPSCGGLNKACNIVVAEGNTTGTGSSRVLNFSLHAMPGGGGSYVPDQANTPQVFSLTNRQ